jgi:hypothetical protein
VGLKVREMSVLAFGHDEDLVGPVDELWVTFCTAAAFVPAERASYSLEMRKRSSAVGLRSRLPVQTKSSLVLITGITTARRGAWLSSV